jgi:tetratricopeptide (TPR) repeat protein
MKKILLLAAMYTTIANAQVRMPAPSSTQTITQDFGLGKIELTYSRPNIKGRTVFKENSELAPLGKVWRTGANASTKIKFTDPVSIADHAVDTGSYALWTIPGKKEWTIIINKDSKNWGTNYVETDDLFRFTVAVDNMKEVLETLTMQITDVKPESCTLVIMWANAMVRIPITTNIKDRVKASIEQALGGDKISATTYYLAANYYFEWEKDYNKALPNINKAVEANPKNFAAYLLKAKIEKALGDKVSAKGDAEKVVELATAAKNDDYVRAAKEVLKSL